MSGAVLRVRKPHRQVAGVALVLHGGRSQSIAPTRPWQLAVLRMLPFAWSLRRGGAADGLAVARLRYGVRGWNGADRSPVADAESALADLAQRFPDVPVALVGHSMGARTALYVAAHPAVRVVVGLAPWIEPGDERTIPGLAGRRVLLAHGALDRMTNPRSSEAYARAAAGTAASMSYVSVTADKHAMLGRAGVWRELATGFVLGALWDRSPSGTPAPTGTNGTENGHAGDLARTVAGALAGQAALVV
jgi:pimeloyl-ACP methyl ester carboxylesterase